MGMLHYLNSMKAMKLVIRKHTNHLAGVQRTFNGGIVRDFAKEPNDESPDLEFTGNDGGIFPNGLRQAGARLGKFSFKQFGRPDQDNDYPIIRLGDLYLVRAEANARLAMIGMLLLLELM